MLDYVYDLPFLQLLNSNSLDIVIMQGLSGGIGVILTVPIAAGFSAVLLSRHRQQQADEPEQAKASQTCYSQSQKKGFALSEALLFPLFSFSCRAASPAQCMSWPFSDTATTPALPPS